MLRSVERHTWPRLVAVLLAGVMGAAACVVGGQSAPVVITLATQSVDDHEENKDAAVKAFEQKNPDVRVRIRAMSLDTTLALEQLSNRFRTGIEVPDVVTADIFWIATLVQNGWVMSLDRFHPNKSAFFEAPIKAATVGGKLYAVPWFIDAEGIYYRTDLVQEPKTPRDVVTSASAATRSAGIPYGVAFEGQQYEGLVTAFVDVGGTLDLGRLDTEGNQAAIAYLRDLIHRDHVSPLDVTRWREDDVKSKYVSGQAVFAINWPYVFQAAETDPKSAVKGRTAWIPFPSSAGRPQAALGGWDLVISSRSKHPDEAYRLIQFLSREDVQIARAVNPPGNAPAVQAAYRADLYRKAPWFKDQKAVYEVAVPRPIDPRYPQASTILQAQLERVLMNQAEPKDALATAQAQVQQLLRSGP